MGHEFNFCFLLVGTGNKELEHFLKDIFNRVQ